MHPFTSDAAAERYSRGRPYYHPLVIGRVRRRLALHAPVSLALDVGCGTGLSTLALADLADRVIGCDPSAAMLARAPADPRVAYRAAPAEALPVPDASCDLLTAASAFHLFDRAAFLREARRVLRPDGWLVLYDNALTGEGVPAFPRWLRDVYLPAHPSPPAANRAPLRPEEAARAGFRFAAEEEYDHTVRFTPTILAAYLLSLDTSVPHDEAVPYAEQRDHLASQVARLFGPRTEATFTFRGHIRYLKRLSG